MSVSVWMREAWECDVAHTMVGTHVRCVSGTVYESVAWAAGVDVEPRERPQPEDYSTVRMWAVYCDGIRAAAFDTRASAMRKANQLLAQGAVEVYLDRVRLSQLEDTPSTRVSVWCVSCDEQIGADEAHEVSTMHDSVTVCDECHAEYFPPFNQWEA